MSQTLDVAGRRLAKALAWGLVHVAVLVGIYGVALVLALVWVDSGDPSGDGSGAVAWYWWWFAGIGAVVYVCTVLAAWAFRRRRTDHTEATSLEVAQADEPAGYGARQRSNLVHLVFMMGSGCVAAVVCVLLFVKLAG